MWQNEEQNSDCRIMKVIQQHSVTLTFNTKFNRHGSTFTNADNKCTLVRTKASFD